MVPGDFAGMHTRKNVDMEAALDCPTMLGGQISAARIHSHLRHELELQPQSSSKQWTELCSDRNRRNMG